MEKFTYAINTRVYFGEGQVSRLGENIAKHSSKVLLAYGCGSIKEHGIYDDVIKQLDEYNIEYVELSGIEPNAKLSMVKEGVRLCKKHGCNGVLAVGGGSVLDCAKVIAGCVYYDGDIWDLISQKVKYEKVLPIFTVLTLSAAGSEMDALAVITDMGRNDKLITGSPHMLPKVSILDPLYTYTVPAYHTAAGSADIYSHLLEPYFTTDMSAQVTDGIAESLMRTVLKYAPVALEEPDNKEARENLMWASSLAVNTLTAKGKRIGWSVHEIEHTVSAYYDITHGVGLAIITPVWMEYVLNEDTAPRFASYATNVFGVNKHTPVMDRAKLAIKLTRDFFTSLGLPQTLREAGINEKTHFDAMAVKAFGPDGRTDSFVPLSVSDVRKILDNAF